MADKDRRLKELEAQVSTQEFKEQMDRADSIAKVLVKHITNEKGEILAHVEENPGFQDVYDYRGGQKRQHRLDRKREEVAWNYQARTHLFQKTYYQTGLTIADEQSLRSSFNSLNDAHERNSMLAQAGMFGAFWPVAWKLSRVIRPSAVFLFAGAYYAGWRYAVQPMSLQMLQSQLNQAAQPLAQKYGLVQ